MENKEALHIQSEAIRSNWEIIKPVYFTLRDAFVKEKSKGTPLGEDEYDLFYEILFDEWKRIYLDVVLNPLRNTITDLFKQALTTEFTLKDTSKVTSVKVYSVFYYILQYFSIGMEPYHEFEGFRRIKTNLKEVGNINRNLYFLFEDLWEEF